MATLSWKHPNISRHEQFQLAKRPNGTLIYEGLPDPIFIISIDPGTTNLAFTLLVANATPDEEVLISECATRPLVLSGHVWNVGGDERVTRTGKTICEKPIDDSKLNTLCQAMLYEVDTYSRVLGVKKLQIVWLIEYQPPLGVWRNPGLVRMNTYVEAFLKGWLTGRGGTVVCVHPASVKHFFRFPKSGYAENKKMAIQIAQKVFGEGFPPIDHLADCAINTLYFLRGSKSTFESTFPYHVTALFIPEQLDK